MKERLIVSEVTTDEIRENLSILFQGHDRDEQQYSEDDLIQFAANAYKADSYFRNKSEKLLNLISGDEAYINSQWVKFTAEIESRKEHIDVSEGKFKSHLLELIDNQRTISKDDWLAKEIDNLKVELSQHEEKSKDNWYSVFTTIISIDSSCRELISELVYDDENLFFKLFNDIKLQNKYIDSDEIIIFAAENGEYFHHIDVTPTICCQDYSKKVVKFKDINNDSLKFYHANSSLIEANTCCKFILNESFDDAISNVINLFYRFIPIIFNISREEAFRKLGHKGSNSRWGPQQQQRTDALQLAEKLWKTDEYFNADHAKMADHLVCLPKEHGSFMFDKLTKERLLPEIAKLATQLNKPVRGRKNSK